jgi:hypothetical protein
MDFTGFAVQVGNVQLRLSFQGIDKLTVAVTTNQSLLEEDEKAYTAILSNL